MWRERCFYLASRATPGLLSPIGSCPLCWLRTRDQNSFLVYFLHRASEQLLHKPNHKVRYWSGALPAGEITRPVRLNFIQSGLPRLERFVPAGNHKRSTTGENMEKKKKKKLNEVSITVVQTCTCVVPAGVWLNKIKTWLETKTHQLWCSGSVSASNVSWFYWDENSKHVGGKRWSNEEEEEKKKGVYFLFSISFGGCYFFPLLHHELELIGEVTQTNSRFHSRKKKKTR